MAAFFYIVDEEPEADTADYEAETLVAECRDVWAAILSEEAA